MLGGFRTLFTRVPYYFGGPRKGPIIWRTTLLIEGTEYSNQRSWVSCEEAANALRGIFLKPHLSETQTPHHNASNEFVLEPGSPVHYGCGFRV